MKYIHLIVPPDYVDLLQITEAQTSDFELKTLKSNRSLKLQLVPLTTSDGNIWCDCSTGTPHPASATTLSKAGLQYLAQLVAPRDLRINKVNPPTLRLAQNESRRNSSGPQVFIVSAK
ncbi:unnamed protein product [Echinostoma caproni]|uniref:PIH1_CS domain-containing protein n=1 Tax=Echinostoma caproni TaxID=27848 RepID=A0A183A4U2_9TREM|nr:unnamed protein product [Echinostoma caproni]